MCNKKIEKEIKIMRSYAKNSLSKKQNAKKFFISAGIITDNSKLTSKYK